MVELSGAADRRVKGYSLGMRQRLALAAALLGEPRILILDEPANGLDPQGMRWLRDLLRAQAAEGRTVLVSSHLLSEVAQTADELVMIRARQARRPDLAGRVHRRRRQPDPGRGPRTWRRWRAGSAPSGAECRPRRRRGAAGQRASAASRSASWRWRAGSRSTNSPPQQLEPRGALPRADGRRGGRARELPAQRVAEALDDADHLGDARHRPARGGALRRPLHRPDRRSGRSKNELAEAEIATGVGLLMVLMLVLGVLIVTTEFRHGTSSSTFLASPQALPGAAGEARRLAARRPAGRPRLRRRQRRPLPRR